MMETASSPVVSIIMVAWNSDAHLPHCLSGVSAQTFKSYELILVDNNSLSDPLALLQNQHLEFYKKTHRLDANYGFAVANNLGVRLARGKWIALLNADAYPEPDWLEKIVNAAEQNPQYSMFSSRQVQYKHPDLLDGAGDAYHISGLAWRNYYNYPSNEYGLEQREVFSPCAAAALYSREEFLKIGGFDEDYFSYFEDIDLGFRLRLSGAKCLYVPEAVVRHVGSASTGKRSDFSVYYGYRNLIWTFIKDMPSPYFWLFLPLHISALIFFFLYLTLRGQGKAISRAIWDALHGLPNFLVKRKYIQNDIKITPQDLKQVMSTGLFEPYREFINRNRAR